MEFSREMLELYAVTDRRWLRGKSLGSQVRQALSGGVTMVQLREKEQHGDGLIEEAREIREICHSFGVPFLIDDDVELARKVDADGVHVGQEDMEAARARSILGPGKILGVSARTLEQARAAEAAGADYLGVGAVFPTGTKGDAKLVSLELLREICDSVKIPVVAIGGIGRENLLQLSGSGIAGVAVVSAIFAQEDIEGAARNLKELVGKEIFR
ncbi:MAG: thiamine phosphate synthase [Selenomonadaceae bacterium]|nr:thiamine phosphate synthase [Selenomonadaceae bacterium]MBQ1510123.1 thiamine phosphate synthase [Selenomonadaceae bacterium]MBQ1915499.1 thiamine phosphate synthase [Selenomonadaceae bacterium]